MYPSGTSHESSLSLMATPPHVPSDNEDASSDSASIAVRAAVCLSRHSLHEIFHFSPENIYIKTEHVFTLLVLYTLYSHMVFIASITCTICT